MESKLVKGLYLTGELLDIDGICGGYNRILHGPPVRLQEPLQQKRSNYDSNQTIKIED